MKIPVHNAPMEALKKESTPLGGRASGARASHQPAGFTMIEVAISLGILAFALVAIVGVLPSGMKVQRENREGTVVNQDASFLLEAIRGGAKGVDILTNYVESITVRRGAQITTYTNNVFRPAPYVPLSNAEHIVALLSTPKVERLPNGNWRTNRVTARMRAISGNALEKSTNALDFALRYQVTTEVMPYVGSVLTNAPILPSNIVGALSGEPLRAVNMARNLYDVRVIIQWPLFQKGTGWDVGRYRRTVRTLVSAELVPSYTNTVSPLYLFQPNTFISAY